MSNRSGTHVARSTEKITLDDLNDSAAVNTYIANLIRNGLLTTRNKLQLLLDDNLTKKQLMKAYIQLGYGITEYACNQFSKVGMIQLHVDHYESIYPTSLRSSADDVDQPHDVDSQEMKDLARVPDHVKCEDSSLLYCSGMMRTKIHLERLVGLWSVPKKVRHDADSVLSLIEYRMSDEGGDFYPKIGLQFGGRKKFGQFVAKLRKLHQDNPFYMVHWLNTMEFPWTSIQNRIFQDFV